VSRGERIAVIGELNVDLIATGLTTPPVLGREILARDFQMTLGSASAIFACGVARLGHEVTFFSKVGADDFGEFCMSALRDSAVSVRNIIQDASLKTGVTISLSTREDRALVTYLGAISELTIEQVPLDLLNGHSHLHLTSYFLQHGLRPSFPEILRAAKSRGLTTSVDPNSDPDSEWGSEIHEVLGLTDILFINESEALQLTRREAVEHALQELAGMVGCAVVKLGPKGAVAVRGTEVVWSNGFAVEAVDTTGAGDSFAAGFLHGFVKGRGLTECLTFGNASGALSTLDAGGTAAQPTEQQLNDFLEAHQA
jgi:sugar/nucleoside kinase (ribokinase family)